MLNSFVKVLSVFRHIIHLVLLCAVIFLSSCHTAKRITYLQTEKDQAPDSLYLKLKPGYKLQPEDVLYINIITGNKETDDIFNPLTTTVTSQVRPENLYIFGYIVDEAGEINLPIIGKIPVAGLTIEESKVKINEYAKNYLNNAHITVKIATFNFVVLGEVKNPGYFQLATSQINIFEAIAMAGDITYYGKRKKAILVRQFENGTKTYDVDLTKRDLLKSEAFYVQPNDLIYIPPVYMATFRSSIQDYLIILSSITSTITAVALVISLTK